MTDTQMMKILHYLQEWLQLSTEIRHEAICLWEKMTESHCRLVAALERLVDDCPFDCNTDTCECGENGNGRDDDGNICNHIQARRALAIAKEK